MYLHGCVLVISCDTQSEVVQLGILAMCLRNILFNSVHIRCTLDSVGAATHTYTYTSFVTGIFVKRPGDCPSSVESPQHCCSSGCVHPSHVYGDRVCPYGQSV